MKKYILLLIFPFFIYSQNTLEDLISEIQITQADGEYDPDALEIVWWMPPEFWEKSFEGDPSISAQDAKNIIQIFEDYTVFAICSAELNYMGVPKYKSSFFIKNNISLIDNRGRRYYPKQDINNNAEYMFSFLQTYFTQLMGDMGENIHLVMFPSNIVNPLDGGDFKVFLGNKKFTFNLPIGALLPPKYCSKCNKTYSGKWSFCPFTGNYLK